MNTWIGSGWHSQLPTGPRVRGIYSMTLRLVCLVKQGQRVPPVPRPLRGYEARDSSLAMRKWVQMCAFDQEAGVTDRRKCPVWCQLSSGWGNDSDYPGANYWLGSWSWGRLVDESAGRAGFLGTAVLQQEPCWGQVIGHPTFSLLSRRRWKKNFENPCSGHR